MEGGGTHTHTHTHQEAKMSQQWGGGKAFSASVPFKTEAGLKRCGHTVQGVALSVVPSIFITQIIHMLLCYHSVECWIKEEEAR